MKTAAANEFVIGTGLLLAAVLALFQACGVTAPPPPFVQTTDFDPAIAAAIAQARQAVLDSPRSADARGRMGMVLLAHEIQADARECFIQAAALAPLEPRWPYYLGLSQLVDSPMSAATNLDRAVRLLAQTPPRGSAPARPKDANATLAPSNEQAPRLRLADTLLTLGQLDEAEAHYRRVWQVASNSAPAALGLGKIANTRDRLADAADFLAVAARHPATRKAAHRLLLGVCQRLGRTNETEQLKRVLAELPNDQPLPDPFLDEIERLKTGERVWIDRGDEWIKTGRVAEAARLFEKTLQSYPNSDRAMFYLGRARLRLGDSAGAAAILERALQLEPNSVEILVQLGVVRLTQRRAKDAQHCFRAAIQAKPNLGEAWFNLGLSLGQENRAESIASFREAIRLKPNLIEAYLGLAVVLRADGQDKAAASELRRALALQPEDPLRQKLLQQLKLAERH